MGDERRGGAQTSPINVSSMMPPASLPPPRPEMSLCGAMVTAGVLAEADVTVGSPLKRETRVCPENQEMRPAEYTCWPCV